MVELLPVGEQKLDSGAEAGVRAVAPRTLPGDASVTRQQGRAALVDNPQRDPVSGGNILE